MTYRGTVKNGKVELEEGPALPEGAIVRVEAIEPGEDPADGLADDAVSTSIPDLASQHDDYIYGMPKRQV